MIAGLGRPLRLAALAFCLCFALQSPALAAGDDPKIAMPEGTCTNDHQFDIQENQIISTIANDLAGDMASITSDISSNMYEGVGSIGGIGTSIQAMCELYILINGILFMLGVIQGTIYEFISRLGKVAIVASLAGNGSQLNSVMQNFFEQGTYDIIIAVSGGSLPMGRVDQLLDAIISPKMIVTLVTIATTGFYGPFLFLVIVSSLQSIIGAILNAAWIFLMSQVIRGILYGVAPIFIACALFQRTKDFYQGWLNQLVNACLQPIFLFTFFTFFINLIGNVLTRIMDTPICLTPMPDTARGSAVNSIWWRFTNNYEQYDGPWGASTGFPVDIFQIFIFFILADLVSRFGDIVLSLAKSISGAATNMTRAPLMSSWPSPRAGGGGGHGGDSSPPARKEPPKPTDNSTRESGSKDFSREKKEVDPTTAGTTIGKRGAAGGQMPGKGKKTKPRSGSIDEVEEEEDDDEFKKEDPFEHADKGGHKSPRQQSSDNVGKRRDIKVPKKDGE